VLFILARCGSWEILIGTLCNNYCSQSAEISEKDLAKLVSNITKLEAVDN